MGLKKGMTNNPKGKPPGTLNKMSRDMKLTIHEFLTDHWPEVEEEFHKLSGKDKLNFYKDLLQYDLPKQAAVAMSGELNFKEMSEETLNAICERLLNVKK
ncbi:MAG: hypothetical protein GX646_03145 [Bacteroidales bacterium]|nr:hypothetical protein [Bacteroidales bacterium]